MMLRGVASALSSASFSLALLTFVSSASSIKVAMRSSSSALRFSTAESRLVYAFSRDSEI